MTCTLTQDMDEYAYLAPIQAYIFRREIVDFK